MRIRVCELLLSKKREDFDDRINRFSLNSPKGFFNELKGLTGRQKKNGNFIIADIENKLNTDDFAVSNLFNEKLVLISKILAASIFTVPSTTQGMASNEKSFSIQLIPGNH